MIGTKQYITTEAAKPSTAVKADYSLTGVNARKAVEMGLAEADWYQTPVAHDAMRNLLARKNGPAIRDTSLLVLILLSTGALTILLWGTWWVILPYAVYAVFYGTSSDSRWHECGHGTAFRTDWLNTVVYEAASFMVMRESVVWRWSHIRHHSDTIIVGRDPEIQLPRPPDIKGLILSLVNFAGYINYFPGLVRHAAGRVTEAEKTYIPATEFGKVYRNARIVLAIYLLVIALAIFVFHSWVPIFLFILPQFFGTWLMIVHNTTQHAGLAENVLDHRLNCRTVYMNPISRFIYWNMNYHVEHHMFPLVPYHALPKLHKLVKDDCPPVYPSIYAAWKEIIPALLKQLEDPAYYVKRKLPQAKAHESDNKRAVTAAPDAAGWLNAGNAAALKYEDVIRVDCAGKTFAVYRNKEGQLFATDGICTHGNTHLSQGWVKGNIIECPKHNGRFNITDGSPARAPVCRGLATYPVQERSDHIWINVKEPAGAGARREKTYKLRVVSNENVATFIKELVLEAIGDDALPAFTPGDYMQVVIPVYGEILFTQLDIQEPYRQVWQQQGVFKLSSSNALLERRNNYSIASNNKKEKTIRFNVRIATPPPGQDCTPGIGSSYIFNLKPGDVVTAAGPAGDFHIKATQQEMVYIGGGAGMAPIRAHIAHLFENETTSRKVSYWYGARSKQELFYEDYFMALANQHPNFNFQPALSQPLEEDRWQGHQGFIHEVVLNNYLKTHADVQSIEFYLCGPPIMIKACTRMLEGLGVNKEQVAYDEF